LTPWGGRGGISKFVDLVKRHPKCKAKSIFISPAESF
jgi:hypothetical protein